MDIRLSSKEIYFLSELLHIEVIVGMTDPFAGNTQSELKEALFQIQEDLIEKEILFEKETFEIERRVAILINAMRPQSVYLRLSRIEQHQQEDTHYYFTPKLVVKRTKAPDADIHKIELIGTPLEAFTEIVERFSLSHVEKVDSGSVYLSRDTFNQLLQSQPVDMGPEIEAFLYSLKTRKLAGQVEVITWDDQRGNWDTADLSFIHGENGVWLTTPETVEGVKIVYIQPVAGVEIEEQIKKLILE
ncbi:hypothetical protein [Neobacillus vireti]|uniref:hypothetical protein n=1 Tax=Neobacillus vireti TaxID=220686 RepID=UPI002FFF40A0